MTKKFRYFYIFIISVLSLLMSIWFSTSLGLFADEFHTAPAKVLNGNMWLNLSNLRPVLASVIVILMLVNFVILRCNNRIKGNRIVKVILYIIALLSLIIFLISVGLTFRVSGMIRPFSIHRNLATGSIALELMEILFSSSVLVLSVFSIRKI